MVDTITRPSTTALDVTRNDEKDERRAEEAKKAAMAAQANVTQGQRPS